MVQWNLPKAVGLHAGAITGSCSVTAYPRPFVIVQINYECDYKRESVHIEGYTTTVVFTINNVTRKCETIRCYILPFGKVNSTELLIVGKYY